MTQLQIKVGDIVLIADWEEQKAPKTCAAVKGLLPMSGDVLQARWSGEAAWVPLDDAELSIEFENHTCYPSKGELLIYPGFISVKEILIPYGPTVFGSKMGALPGKHFATVVDGRDRLEELGHRVVWQGAQSVELTEVGR